MSSPPEPSPASQRRSPDRDWSIAGGLILVLVGVYFFLDETLGLNLPSFGELWPILVIVVGAWLIVRALARREA
ncbi:MAG TPA: DUF5668 domain-containing protein [Candidatus Limnocylindrales bacterium]|nr:DUF5668 domain-containing protein [Candidatus Limnocylindrales bacterium]